MVGGNVARGCLSACSTRELWAAWLAAELTKCHLFLAGGEGPPGAAIPKRPLAVIGKVGGRRFLVIVYLTFICFV
jgi:hypothetical protein